VTPRPYHHNNLRAVLLEQAEEVLRTAGADKLSLRELARKAGVSHGAPRSHFIDRQALLDALAERGFQERADGPAHERFRQVARTYVAFAVEDAALMELMFATKVAGRDGAADRAAIQLFEVFDGALAAPSPQLDADDARDRFKVLFAATLQGTATLIATQRVSGDHADRLIDDATDLLLDSQLGRRVLPGAGGQAR
jgi:AcrR family transcriptional regulator